jgi:hypothetical protein
VRARLATIALAVLACGCGLLPGERPKLTVGNGTELVVAIFVNGLPVGQFPPDGPGPEIDESQLPPLPWDVEAKTVGGRTLLTMHVDPGQLHVNRQADGGIEASIAMERAELSCGTLWLWAGEITPSGPAPDPNAGAPGDCLP